MILKRGFVDLRGEYDFVGGVRLGRIKMLWPFTKRAVKDIFGLFLRGVGITKWSTVASDQEEKGNDKQGDLFHIVTLLNEDVKYLVEIFSGDSWFFIKPPSFFLQAAPLVLPPWQRQPP